MRLLGSLKLGGTIKKLIKGVLEFKENVRPNVKETFKKLALGQSPDALLVACSDSRVAPNVFASTDPGDVFVVRNVGNLIPAFHDYESGHLESEGAAIEFSVNQLNVKDIIVCGHSECGAMQALFKKNPSELSSYLRSWLKNAHPAKEKLDQGITLDPGLSPHNQLSQLNVLAQIEHIKSYPNVAQKIKNQELKIHGWWFDLAEANVYTYNEKENRFVIINAKYLQSVSSK